MIITEFHLLITLIILTLINILVHFFRKTNQGTPWKDTKKSIIKFDSTLTKTNETFKDELYRNRKELNDLSRSQREELNAALQTFQEKLEKKFEHLTANSEKRLQAIQTTVEKHLTEIRTDNNKQLEQVRKTVDEKLQKTLNERLHQSFELVGKQLEAVQSGLGEMKTLATDVGGLKKVLNNVKMRGGVGEIQLEMLLEQILAPEQYEKNVKTKKSSNGVVEFAVKLPGKDDTKQHVWLPIDAKFPKDAYEQMQTAHESGDLEIITTARKNLHNTIKKMAKDIQEKYLDPPATTNFGIMFLPFEGIYAEVVQSATLLETLQREHQIIVTGPSTLAAMLNSLQMGFRTLAIQKRSNEVWKVLASVKKEFENFGGMMEKAQKNIQTGLNQLDTVMGVRTRAIQKKLDKVSTIESDNALK
ncbi:DNA recombination protein RmuC [bacterium DOLZORAL124_38_8]|nr:MAG: DNA recombination protein RmuC [bacterium DOLZORAL124_38_8]